RCRDRLLERLYRTGLSVDLDVPTFLRFAGQVTGERLQAVREWLLRAREPVHRWLAASPGRPAGASGLATLATFAAAPDPLMQACGFGSATRPTRAYADLTLAYGLARLGERAACQDLAAQAREVPGGGDA